MQGDGEDRQTFVGSGMSGEVKYELKDYEKWSANGLMPLSPGRRSGISHKRRSPRLLSRVTVKRLKGACRGKIPRWTIPSDVSA